MQQYKPQLIRMSESEPSEPCTSKQEKQINKWNAAQKPKRARESSLKHRSKI